MYKLKSVFVVAALAAPLASNAGGLLTNTNQNIVFLRNIARDAAIGIDGVYSNPAGVAFMSNGLHLSLNIQNAHQTRTIKSEFAPFAFGEGNSADGKKTFKGKADAPVIPSIQAVYNKGGWSFQFNFAITGGGGKCVFDNGLGSFESVVGLLPMLSQNLDNIAPIIYPNLSELVPLGLPQVSGYSMNTFMRGRQYYYGFTFGAARKLSEHWSVYLGARLLYGSSSYYGYVSNIKANIGGQYVDAPETFSKGATNYATAAGVYTQQLTDAIASGASAEVIAEYQKAITKASAGAAILGALGEATQDVTLNCDQTGWGIAPIIGVDYKTGDFNFAAKYEFRTRMNLKNRAANSESAKNIAMLDRFEDGKHVREDSPTLLTVGAQWSVLPQLRVSAGWHHYFDKSAKQFNDHQKKLDGNTNEWLFGAEYDVNKTLQVSAGVQKTAYSFTPDYMEDISFNVSSYSIGFGVGVNISKKVKLNVAYFQTNYGDYDRQSADYNGNSQFVDKVVAQIISRLPEGIVPSTASETVKQVLTTPSSSNGRSALYGSDSFTRTNRVIGVGVDFKI